MTLDEARAIVSRLGHAQTTYLEIVGAAAKLDCEVERLHRKVDQLNLQVQNLLCDLAEEG